MKIITALTALGLALGGVSAQAATWRFAYASGIGQFSGRIEGTLQADANTVLVDAMTGFVTFNGAALPTLPFLTTGSTLYGSPRAASVTLDGSWLDFLACSDEFCSADGFGFDPDTIEFTPALITSIPAAGYDFGYREAVNAANWSLSAVPEPADWALLIIGFGLIGAVARRKNLAVTA